MEVVVFEDIGCQIIQCNAFTVSLSVDLVQVSRMST